MLDTTSYTDVPGGSVDWTFTDTPSNYADQTGQATVTVTKAPLTVTADDHRRSHGDWSVACAITQLDVL